MSLQTRLQDLVTAVATDIKSIRTSISGEATGALTGLTTTAKTSLIAAINEVNAKPSGTPASASETVAGVAELATQSETDTGTDDARIVTPLKFQTRLAAFAQPKSTNLTDLSGQASTAYGRSLLALVDQAGLTGAIRTASETLTGILRIGTQAEHTTGTADNVYTTPLKLQQKLTAWAQPLSTNLTTLAGVASGAFGRTLLGHATVADTRTALGLAAVATSGSASDITTGTLPTSVLPPLAINETFVVASQAAMLALTAQRGDVAVRTDINRTFILAAEGASTLANWQQINGASDVTSVAGRTGAVTLTKTDVGLANVDNTADSAKPVSTAQAAADDLRLLKTANLSDVANTATALANIGGIASTAIGNPETDLVAAYNTAKA